MIGDARTRAAAWAAIEGPWDVVVVGGGITGAGVLREAARRGWRALLLERRDFAWGASSRSSKFVHGGLRYLAQGQVGLTVHSVRERDRLLREASALVRPLRFVLPVPDGAYARRLAYRVAITLVDRIGTQPRHEWLDAERLRAAAPAMAHDGFAGGYRYAEATTDDARLVLAVLREATAMGAVALNHAGATSLLHAKGRVAGVRARCAVTGAEAEVRATVVVNATGAWANALTAGAPTRARGEVTMRPLRGSHLLVPHARLPLADVVVLPHPADGRPVFVAPWQGATLVGTTDVDHRAPLDEEPRASEGELAYLLHFTRRWFPAAELTADDLLAAYAGVRPVAGGDGRDPSHASRDDHLWGEPGLLTVTGGKLTTFRRMAGEVVRAIAPQLPARAPIGEPELSADEGLDDDGDVIDGTPTTWARLELAARTEAVVHLDDLLLRRTRVGLLRADGGAGVLPRIAEVCRAALGWDEARCATESARYLALRERTLSVG